MSTIATAWHQITADVATAWDFSFTHWWLLIIAAVLVIAMIVADVTSPHPRADPPTGRTFPPGTDTDQETGQP